MKKFLILLLLIPVIAFAQNDSDTNKTPMTIDIATSVQGLKSFRLVQWVDDNADIADGDDLNITLGGQVIAIKVQRGATPDGNVAVWTLGPFNPGIRSNGITVTTIDHGTLLVFYD